MTAAGPFEVHDQRTTRAREPRPLLWIAVLRLLLWMVVLVGPLAAGVLAVQVAGLRQRVEMVSRQSVMELPADTARAEGFAQSFLAAYLNSDDGTAPPVGSLDARSLSVMPQGWSAIRTVSLGAEEVASGYFAVTVAAEIEASDPDSVGEPLGILFYTVGVVETEEGWAAVGPPALVAAPPTSPPPDLLIHRMNGLRDVPSLEEAVTRFLAAYLAGEGELARYTAPGSSLRAVQPPPFTSVEILDTGSVSVADGARHVLVLVAGTDKARRSQVLQYGLVVAEREGRWEVVELLPAPPLATGNDN